MSGGLLHDAVAEQLMATEDIEIDCQCHRTSQDAAAHVAVAVLSPLEMQAIRRVLHGMSVCRGIESKRGMLLDSFDLPDAVREWARGPVVDMEFGFLSLPDTDQETSS